MDPRKPWPHEGLGLTLYDLDRLEEAHRHLTEAARIDSAMDKGRQVLAKIEARWAAERGSSA